MLHANPARRTLYVLASCLTSACTGTIATDADDRPRGGDRQAAPGAPDNVAPGAGPATPSAPTGEPATPLPPDALDRLCTQDVPHPRRALRLSNDELLATLRALGPLEDAALPVGFGPAVRGARPEEGLTVSRAFFESADALATGVATKIAATPTANSLARLGCPVADFGKDEACTRAFLTTASARMFRGLSRAEDVTNLLGLVKGVAQRTDGKTALEYGVRAMALHPKALYLLEGLDLPAGADPAVPSLMSAGEMASFLSYRILGGPPGEALVRDLTGALAGAPTVASLRRLIEAHFTPSDLRRNATNYLAATLNVADISGLLRDTRKHPGADAAFMARLQTETYEAISAAVTAETTFADVLTRPQRVRSVGDDTSPAFGRFGRAGLFLLPGALASVSTVNHTDIPRRGRFLLRQLFCDNVPSPPANLLTMLPPLPGTPSERQRFEKVEREPNCRSCHVRVNRLGFALENYDEMGVVRAEDEHGNVIDPASTHEVTGAGPLAFTGAQDLFTQAAQHPVAQSCLALQAFRHFARRYERGDDGRADACLVRDIAAAGKASGFRLVDMFTEALARTALAKRGG